MDKKIVCLHRKRTENVGDLMSCPVIHFASMKNVVQLEIRGHLDSDSASIEERNLWHENVSRADCIIIGGGGLLGIEFFQHSLDYIFSLKKKTATSILWGAGHNEYRISDWREMKYPLDIDIFPFDLIGVRDFGHPYRWVPCSSCMHPYFDEARLRQNKRQIGLFVHEGTLKNESLKVRLPLVYDIMTNDADFETIIDFLSTSGMVLTDSYHGMYWATLLNKKVVAFPSSSKFYDSAFPVPLCDPGDWQRFAPLAKNYPTALELCREKNIEFSSDVNVLISK